jgi:hypothetical protein
MHTAYSTEAAPFGLSVGPNTKMDKLGPWRTERLGHLKQTAEYQGLPPVVQRTIDHLVKRYENPVKGAFPKQEKLAKAMGYSTRTIGKYLRMAVKAGALTCTPQGRWGTHGGSLPNVYRVNSDLWENGSTEPQVHIEVPNQVPSQVPTEAFTAVEVPLRGTSEAQGVHSKEEQDETHPEGVRLEDQDPEAKTLFGAPDSAHLIGSSSPFASIPYVIDYDQSVGENVQRAIEHARDEARARGLSGVEALSLEHHAAEDVGRAMAKHRTRTELASGTSSNPRFS